MLKMCFSQSNSKNDNHEYTENKKTLNSYAERAIKPKKISTKDVRQTYPIVTYGHVQMNFNSIPLTKDIKLVQKKLKKKYDLFYIKQSNLRLFDRPHNLGSQLRLDHLQKQHVIKYAWRVNQSEFKVQYSRYWYSSQEDYEGENEYQNELNELNELNENNELVRQNKLKKLYFRKIYRIQFPNLKILNLSKNNIQSVQGLAILYAPNLVCMQLHSNQIRSINFFSKTRLKKLKVLTLYANPIRDVDLVYRGDFMALDQYEFNQKYTTNLAFNLQNIDFIYKIHSFVLTKKIYMQNRRRVFNLPRYKILSQLYNHEINIQIYLQHGRRLQFLNDDQDDDWQ